MTTEMSPEEISRQLAEHAYVVVPDFLASNEVRSLAEDFERLRGEGAFRAAGIGRGSARREASEIRRDEVCWWEAAALSPAQAPLWERWETLRASVNRELQLGAWSLEAHYAHYAPGAFYGRHLDRFADSDTRVLSLVLYLNEAWAESDGGLLHLYLEPAVQVRPKAGTLVAFLSDRVPHEVAPTTRERRSIAGWFRRRSV